MRSFPRLRHGESLEPWHLNVIYAELERWSKLTGVGATVRHGDLPQIIVAPRELLVLARTTHGVVPARHATTGFWGQQTVTLYDDSQSDGEPRSLLGLVEEIAFNKGPAAVPGDRDVFCLRGLDGRLLVINVFC